MNQSNADLGQFGPPDCRPVTLIYSTATAIALPLQKILMALLLGFHMQYHKKVHKRRKKKETCCVQALIYLLWACEQLCIIVQLN